MANTGPEIVLVRHGETEWSLTGQHTGRTDIPLTEHGREQGEMLRRRLEGRGFERVFTSPLSRARETCRLAGFADQAEDRDELLEWDYGAYEGLTTKEIRETRPGWTVWADGSPDGESAAAVGARVDPLVADLRALEGDAVLFAHGHVLRVLAARWIGLPAAAGASLAMGTASVSVLGRERETPAIWLWNGGAHLDRGAEGGAES